MQIKYLAQGNNILLPGFEPSTSVTRNRHSNQTTTMLRMTAKATIRRMTRGGKYIINEFVGFMAQKEKSLTAEKNQNCQGKSR